MCTIPLALMAASTAMSAYGQYTQGQVANKIAQNNATMAGYAAQDAQQRGELQAQQSQRQADMAQGAARARLAANGVDVGVGTAGDLQAQNDFFGQYNANQARFNAAREAWSDRTQQSNFLAEGAAAAQQGRLGAFSTVLGGSAQVAGKWYAMNNPDPAPAYAGNMTGFYGGNGRSGD